MSPFFLVSLFFWPFFLATVRLMDLEDSAVQSEQPSRRHFLGSLVAALCAWLWPVKKAAAVSPPPPPAPPVPHALDALAAATTYTYDPYGYLVSPTGCDRYIYLYDALHQVTTYVYDARPGPDPG